MAPEPSNSKIGKSVGERIRAARVALKYTQSQLASPDFSVSYISAIERGQIHPSLRALEIIAARLGIPSSQFLPHRSQPGNGPAQSVQPEREEDENELFLLSIYLLLAQLKAQSALAQLEKVSARRMKREQQLHHRYLLGRAYFQLGRFQECEQLFVSLVDAAKDADNTYIYLHALSLLGSTYAALHNYASALLSHHHCLDLLLAAEARDAFFIARTYEQLGEDYARQEDYTEAARSFTFAIETTGEFVTPSQSRAIYNALYTFYMSKNDLFVATLYANQTMFAGEQVNRSRERSDVFYALGKTIVAQDSRLHEIHGSRNGVYNHSSAAHSSQESRESQTTIPTTAYATLQELLQQEKSTAPRDALTLAALNICLAEWLLTHRRIDEALECVQEALSSALLFGDTLILADGLFLLGRIDYEREQFAEGDGHFQEGLTVLERLGLKEDITRQAEYYAQQLEKRGNDREALAYFRRAFESSRAR